MAAFGHLAADFLSQFDRLPDKPLKCNQCLTFWLSIGPFILEHGWLGLPMAGVAAIVSELIYKALIRL
jgi:hypothetical protein